LTATFGLRVPRPHLEHVAIHATIPRLLTVPQVAERLGVNRTTVYRLIHENELPAVRLRGGSKRAPLRIPEDEFLSWLYADPPEDAS
jgi:excisionase family DNA binding protein